MSHQARFRKHASPHLRLATVLLSLALAAGCRDGPTQPTVSVALSAESVSLLGEDSRTLTAVVSGSENRDVTWSTSNAGVATVSPAGVVSAVAAGSATIVATSVADPTKSASAHVDVTVVQIADLTPGSPALEVGATQRLQVGVSGTTNGSVDWSTTNASIAKVDATGLVTGVAPGTATITASSALDPRRSVTWSVQVLAPVQVTITPQSASLEKGSTRQFTAAVSRTGLGTTWSSSAPSVATVDENGLVAAIALGSATITARAGTASADAAVIVVPPPATGYRVQVANANVQAGGTIAVVAYLVDARDRPVADAGRIVDWTTSQPGGSFVPATSTTAPDGSTTVEYRSGQTAGSWTLRATDRSGLTGTTTVATWLPGPPSATTERFTYAWFEPYVRITAHGTVNPNGLPTEAWFEYSLSPGFETVQATPRQSVGSGTDVVAVSSVPADEGTPDAPPRGAPLYYRIVVQNIAGITRAAALVGNAAAKPTNLRAISVSDLGITVAWDYDWGNADGYFGFRLTRRRFEPNYEEVSIYHASSPSGGATPLGITLLGDIRSLADSSFDVLREQRWRYTLSACNVFGCGTDSVDVTAPRSPPPTLLRIDSVRAGVATLSWTDNSSVETGFQILQVPRNSQFGLEPRVVLTTAPNVTSGTVKQPDPVTYSFSYFVRALVPGVAPDGWQRPMARPTYWTNIVQVPAP